MAYLLNAREGMSRKAREERAGEVKEEASDPGSRIGKHSQGQRIPCARSFGIQPAMSSKPEGFLKDTCSSSNSLFLTDAEHQTKQ